PRRAGPRLTDRAEAADEALLVDLRRQGERVADGAGGRGLVARAPGRRRFGAEFVVDSQRLGRGVDDVAVPRVEDRFARRVDVFFAEGAGVGRVLPVGVRAAFERARVRVVVGGLDPLVLARDHEAGGAGPHRGAFFHVVHPSLGP